MPSVLPPSSAAPFDLRPPDVRAGTALLFHGFTGTPYEVLPLAMHLSARGIRSVGPRYARNAWISRRNESLTPDEKYENRALSIVYLY